ncbi:MAG: hypothetical protein HY319_00645 [Armatimonadetes bacterium]|nr:hypothetical protein [Armatimonadota bacterium]
MTVSTLTNRTVTHWDVALVDAHDARQAAAFSGKASEFVRPLQDGLDSATVKRLREQEELRRAAADVQEVSFEEAEAALAHTGLLEEVHPEQQEEETRDRRRSELPGPDDGEPRRVAENPEDAAHLESLDSREHARGINRDLRELNPDALRAAERMVETQLAHSLETVVTLKEVPQATEATQIDLFPAAMSPAMDIHDQGNQPIQLES